MFSIGLKESAKKEEKKLGIVHKWRHVFRVERVKDFVTTVPCLGNKTCDNGGGGQKLSNIV